MASKNRRGASLNHFSGESRALFAEERALAKVALRLSDLLESKQLSQRALAQKLGVSEGRISQILSADANLTIRTLARIADALDLALDLAFCDRAESEIEEDSTEEPYHLQLVQHEWQPVSQTGNDNMDDGDNVGEMAA